MRWGDRDGLQNSDRDHGTIRLDVGVRESKTRREQGGGQKNWPSTDPGRDWALEDTVNKLASGENCQDVAYPKKRHHPKEYDLYRDGI